MRRNQRLQILVFAVLILGLNEWASAQIPGETCNPRRNPHSFACQEETFRGRIFPMKPAEMARMVGAWRSRLAVTDGREFRTLFDPRAPARLLGVENLRDGSRMGAMSVSPGSVQISGFGSKGVSLKMVPGTLSRPDQHTLQFQMRGDGRSHGFQCRLFDRKNLTHILCRWQTASNGAFVQRGFLGFIR